MTHLAQVRVYHEGTLFAAGEPVDYRGPPDWKYQPTDPQALSQWQRETADPDRVELNGNGHVGLTASGRVQNLADG